LGSLSDKTQSLRDEAAHEKSSYEPRRVDHSVGKRTQLRFVDYCSQSE
jgi:hypothetical protein